LLYWYKSTNTDAEYRGFQDLYYTMVAQSETAPSFDGSDGGLLNGFFPRHYLWPPHLVAWKRTVTRFKVVWTDFPVSAVDFTGFPKPWDPRCTVYLLYGLKSTNTDAEGAPRWLRKGIYDGLYLL
jgi:hypothetical protein